MAENVSSKSRLLDRVLNALVEKAVYVNLDLVRSLGPIGGLGQVPVHFVLERLGGVVDGLDLLVFRSGYIDCGPHKLHLSAGLGLIQIRDRVNRVIVRSKGS